MKEYCPDCADRVDVSHGDAMSCSTCGAVLGKTQPLKVHMPPCVNYSHDKQETPVEKSMETGYKADIKNSMGEKTLRMLPDSAK